MKTENQNNNPLHQAIQMRLPVESVQKIIHDGVNFNELDSDGYSPLINAIDAQLDEVAHLLIDYGADINFVDQIGANALYYAVMNGSWSLFTRLVELGSDPGLVVDQYPLLNVACGRAHKFRPYDLRITKKENGQVTGVKIKGKVGHVSNKERYENFLKIIQWLVELGMDINSIEGNGQTGVALCASRGDVRIIKYLLGQGADVNQMDVFGLSPLHWASRSGQLEIVKLLLQNGANANATEAYGFTPLHEAAENGHVDIAKALIAAGADPSPGLIKPFAPYRMGDTPKDVAIRRRLVPVVEFFNSIEEPSSSSEFSRETKSNPLTAFVIVCFSVSQGAIDHMSTHERFSTFEEAQTYRRRHYKDEGFFWTGLHEYKIIELENGQLKNAFRCNHLHEEYLKKYITKGGFEKKKSGFRL